MDYQIKKQAATIESLIQSTSGSAEILKDALARVASEPDFRPIGMIMEERFLQIIRESLPEESTAEQWREYRLDTDAHRRKIVYHNVFCGCEIWVEYFFGNTQYIRGCGFLTMTGGGREYRTVDPDGVKIYRLRHTVEEI